MSSADLQGLQPVADFSRGGPNGKAITVFCWSRTEPQTPRWDQAERMGTLAATNGFSVISGGYCGSMEAVSKGAREAIGTTEASKTAEVIGVTVSTQFKHRVSGNKYLTRTMDAVNLCHRLHLLTAHSRYFVLLPGTMGSLTELLIIWSLSLLGPKTAPKPIILCLRDPWQKLVEDIKDDIDLPLAEMDLLIFVDSVDEAMAIIIEDSEKKE
eukprot:GILI01014232.1.p1 GENE.GILI01014232.1~~GILI01014232.1.p1  ORF type:complete len:220 (-),score=44.97 GILI01014232.1:89-724(-)